jgi:hypothetical protein
MPISSTTRPLYFTPDPGATARLIIGALEHVGRREGSRGASNVAVVEGKERTGITYMAAGRDGQGAGPMAGRETTVAPIHVWIRHWTMIALACLRIEYDVQPGTTSTFASSVPGAWQLIEVAEEGEEEEGLTVLQHPLQGRRSM